MPNQSYRDLFKSTATYYAKYRPQYPKELIDHVVESFDLDGTGKLLDMGCGTGQLIIPFAPYFELAIGLDSEPEMLEKAKRQAEIADAQNIVWLEASAEDIGLFQNDIGAIRLATFGASFHWMDRDTILRQLDSMIQKGGGIMITASASSTWQYGEDWHQVIKETVNKYLGEKRRAGSGYYVTPSERFEDVLSRSPFSKLETFVHHFERRWYLDGVIGHLYSTSYASPYVLGEKQQAFEAELRARLKDLNPDEKFTETVKLDALLAQRF